MNKNRLINRKSYVYKFFGNFLLVLVIPFFTICFLYIETESTVKNQIVLYNAYTLDQYFRTLDMVVDEMKSICISIAGSEECENYQVYAKLNSKRIGYQSYALKTMLANYPAERYYDIFVYFSENEKIISGVNSSMNTEFYYETYYGDMENSVRDDAEYQEFLDVLNCDVGAPTLYTISGEENTVYLCMAMKYTNYPSKRSYVIAVVLKPEIVNQLIISNIKNQGNIVMMFDKDKEMLISNSEEINEWKLDEYYSNMEPYEMMHEGHTYVMHVKESEEIKGYYVSATPYEYFWRQLLRLKMTCGTGLVLCMLLSIYVAYKRTERVYSPVKEVVSLIGKHLNMTYDVSGKTEFDFMSDAVLDSKEEIDYLRSEIKCGKQVIRDCFLKELFEGRCIENKMADNVFEKNGIVLCSERFFVCVMERSTQNDMDTDMVLFIIKNVYEELCGLDSLGYVVCISTDRYAILTNLRQGVDERKLREIIRETSCFLQKNYKIVLTIGMSSICEGVMEISMAYKEALTALQYSYLLGKGRMIEYSQVKGRRYTSISETESQIFKRLLAYVKTKNDDISPAQFVTEVFNFHGVNVDASLEMVDCFRYEIFSALNKILAMEQIDVQHKNNMLKKMMFQPTLNEFKENLIHLVDVLKQNDLNKWHQEDVCVRAKRYIDENYKDSNLSVNLLGEKLDVSAWYLSKLFKERYNISILDYISRVRIENSKLILRETQKCIQDIAVEMGFLSSNVFIRTFKKWEGITPGAYRGLDLDS